MSLRRDTMAQVFMGEGGGSSEDRIAALRRFRQERRSRNGGTGGSKMRVNGGVWRDG